LTVAVPDINPEALMAHTYETLCSASILTLDLSDDWKASSAISPWRSIA
jgi:hypothetical protein